MDHHLKKGQSGLEFTSMVMVMIFFFVVVSLITARSMMDAQRERHDALVSSVAAVVHEELALAQFVADTYERTFRIPPTLGGFSYNISLNNTFIIVQTRRGSLEKKTINATGSILKGDNTVRRIAGKICINQDPC